MHVVCVCVCVCVCVYVCVWDCVCLDCVFIKLQLLKVMQHIIRFTVPQVVSTSTILKTSTTIATKVISLTPIGPPVSMSNFSEMTSKLICKFAIVTEIHNFMICVQLLVFSQEQQLQCVP